MTDSKRRSVVLAVTADDDRYAATRAEAVRLATEQGGRLILYDWDAATVLGDPLPSNWSADGTAEDTPTELDEAALEAAGRAPIADPGRRGATGGRRDHRLAAVGTRSRGPGDLRPRAPCGHDRRAPRSRSGR